MAVIEIAKIQVRRGQELQTGVPQLEPGEFGWAQDTENLYIGKRIIEGAVDDLNTRILTENDLTNIFAYLRTGGTVANTSTYRYREMALHMNASTSTIAAKLDTSVSLTDYGVIPTFTATDITTKFAAAVADLFRNGQYDSWERNDARRRLEIPAGNYYISSEIKLPPYTDLVGQGPQKTVITLTNNAVPLFRTVDSQYNAYESENMLTGANKAKEVRISGMTLQYSNTIIPQKPLIYLDNVQDARITDCLFQVAYTNSTGTTTNGLVDYGVGISLRGNGNLGTVQTENIYIENCRFNGLQIGIEGTGTVVRPIVKENVFEWLQKGIYLHSTDSYQGPCNGVISHNRFENIYQEAIHVGLNPTDPLIAAPRRSNHISENNYFVNVGNGPFRYDKAVTTGSTVTSVIKFEALGNKSINDIFERRIAANTTATSTLSNSFYFVPLVSGRTSINDESVYTATITTSSVAELIKIPFNEYEQMVNIRYAITNPGLSRKGVAILNIDTNGNAGFTDTYNYMEGLINYSNATENMTPAIPSTQEDFVTADGGLVLIDLVGTTATNLYLTGSNVYLGKAAKVTGINYDGVFFTIETQSANPTFDYTTFGETYTLAFSDNPEISFTLDNGYRNRNYCVLRLFNGSTVVSTDVEFQLDTMV